jgi:hypothetical protein
VLVIIILIAIAGMIGLNAISGRFTPKSDEDEAAEQASAAPPATPAPAPTPMAVLHGPQELAAFSPGGDLGDTKAQDAITIGFSWTPAIQADPVLVFGTIDQLVHSFPDARIQVVDTDLDPSVPLGVSIDGTLVAPADTDGSILVTTPESNALGQAWSFAQRKRAAMRAGPPPPEEPSSAPPKQKKQ